MGLPAPHLVPQPLQVGEETGSEPLQGQEVLDRFVKLQAQSVARRHDMAVTSQAKLTRTLGSPAAIGYLSESLKDEHCR